MPSLPSECFGIDVMFVASSVSFVPFFSKYLFMK